jgi:hypothetical protein
MYCVMLSLDQLQEQMKDTHVAADSKAFTDALFIYYYTKGTDHTGTLENSVVELGKRFERMSRKKAVVSSKASLNSRMRYASLTHQR